MQVNSQDLSDSPEDIVEMSKEGAEGIFVGADAEIARAETDGTETGAGGEMDS